MGILCNALVCMAVWLTLQRAQHRRTRSWRSSSRSRRSWPPDSSTASPTCTSSRIALFIKDFDPAFIAAVGKQVPHLDQLTWPAFFLNNLLPVTIGNIIGGTVLVAAFYWIVFLRPSKEQS